MSYGYIRQYYGIDVSVGAYVQHTVTGCFGIIQPEGQSHHHYVKVRFEGDRYVSNCHPGELDYTADCKAGAA
ncbi:hypothetical protein LH464_17315 [Neorhizobium sp. T786]|uniref:hypothetical protein n=1 Tax=Pseudorhizobium xiangyangii TaxID=2883104 RepID=UPI001CFF6843|nr:hypothetical protein [Neorhizobium xiangyangii]MCB5204228.1 hypothetical protein [Neorhizobium xiangyangii]